jgi:hypothetical protein
MNDDQIVETVCEPEAFWIEPGTGNVFYRCPDASYFIAPDTAIALPADMDLVHVGQAGHLLVFDRDGWRYAIFDDEGTLTPVEGTEDWWPPSSPYIPFEEYIFRPRARPDGFWLVRGRERYLLRHDGELVLEGEYPFGPRGNAIDRDYSFLQMGYLLGLGFSRYDHSCALDGEGRLQCFALWEADVLGASVLADVWIRAELSDEEWTVLFPPTLVDPTMPDEETLFAQSSPRSEMADDGQISVTGP